MKAHTSGYKNAIKQYGKEIDSKITYTLNNETIELGAEELNSISPHYEGSILKSVMKQLDVDSNVDIPVNTIINYQFGVKVNGSFEYVDFGNYVVYKSEKQEDTQSYKLTCYDKMINAMKDYESLGIIYPITVRNYINAICLHLGLTFKNANSTFANYNKQISNELYLTENDEPLGYTFRDVLDELAEVTAGTICIDDNDQLEIRYINDTNDTIDEEFINDVNVNFSKKVGPINTVLLSRSNGTDKVYKSIPENLPEEDRITIEIRDNQIMNFDDRITYLADILTKINGLEYYTNNITSPGITYYDLCDKYNIQIGETTYPSVMLNDDIMVTQGLQEQIYTEPIDGEERDFTNAAKTQQEDKRAGIIVNKQLGEVSIQVGEKLDEDDFTNANITAKINDGTSAVQISASKISLVGKQIALTSDNVSIASTNFNVDTSGNLTCNDATIKDVNIEGGKLELKYTGRPGSLATPYIKLYLNDRTSYMNITGAGASFNYGTTQIKPTNIATTNLSCTQFDAGNIDAGSSSCSSSGDTTVYFHKTFADVPVVVATPVTRTNGVIALKISEITTTYFKINIGGTSFPSAQPFNWIAFYRDNGL